MGAPSFSAPPQSAANSERGRASDKTGRRSMLRLSVVAAAGLMSAQLFATGASAADVVRFLHNETSPASLAFFNKAIADFQTQNPDIKISMETINSDSRLKKILAAVNTRTMPEIVKLNPEERFEMSSKGFVIPLDDVIAAIGEADFVDNSLSKLGGHYYDIPYTLGNYGALWYRKDLLDAAGLKPPTNWEDMKDAAAKLTKGGKFGFAYPAGNNRQTASYLGQLLWSAGGTFFDKDLKVSFDNPATVKTLELLRDLAKSSPPGIGTYSTGEMSNAFTTELVAMEQYAARIMQVLIDLKPDVVAKVGAVPTVVGPTGVAVKYVGPNSFAIGSPTVGAKNTEAAKKFLRFLFERKQMVDFSLTAFPHFVPPLKSAKADVLAAGAAKLGGRTDIGEAAFDTSNGLDLETEAGAGIRDGKLIRSGVQNPYIGQIVARNIPSIVIQKVILEGVAPAEAAKWGAEEMNRVLADLKQ
jgi:ABC-type glycerol-3-phosphate transport system substrate-binding protein